MGEQEKVTKKKKEKIVTNGAEIVKDVMKRQDITIVRLGEISGLGSRQAVYQRLKDGSLNLSTFFRLLNSMNYRIVVEPDMGDIGDKAYIVEGTVVEKDGESK